MSFGTVSVHIFFVISGYLITQSYMRVESFGVFAWHRFLRLAPGVLVALVFSGMMFSRYKGYSGNPIPAPNGSLWTLSWEVTCYMACGIIGMLGILSRRNFNTLFAGLWMLYFSNITQSGAYFLKIEPLFMFFAMGAFIAVNEGAMNVRRAAMLSGIALVIAFLAPLNTYVLDWLRLLPAPMGGTVTDWRIQLITYIVSAPFVLIYLAKYAGVIKWSIRDISYGVYIYAWPVQEVIVYESHKREILLGGWGTFAVALPITLILAYLSCRLIEEPALRMKHAMRARRVRP